MKTSRYLLLLGLVSSFVGLKSAAKISYPDPKPGWARIIIKNDNVSKSTRKLRKAVSCKIREIKVGDVKASSKLDSQGYLSWPNTKKKVADPYFMVKSNRLYHVIIKIETQRKVKNTWEKTSKCYRVMTKIRNKPGDEYVRLVIHSDDITTGKLEGKYLDEKLEQKKPPLEFFVAPGSNNLIQSIELLNKCPTPRVIR